MSLHASATTALAGSLALSTVAGCLSEDGSAQRRFGESETPSFTRITTGARPSPPGARPTEPAEVPSRDDAATEAPPAFVPVALKFKSASAPDVSGFASDTGEVYGARGNGYAYGWSVSHTNRGFYREFIAGYGWAFPFWSRIDMLPGRAVWEIAVPNGSYEVQVMAGGCNNGGVTQRVSLEGVLALEGTPIDGCGGYGEEVVHSTSLVTVSDGRLTLGNGNGALGNRIVSVSVVPKR